MPTRTEPNRGWGPRAVNLRSRRSSGLLLAATAALILAAAGGLAGRTSAGDRHAPQHPAVGTDTAQDALSRQIEGLQRHLRTFTGDAVSWATLGIDYIQQ